MKRFTKTVALIAASAAAASCSVHEETLNETKRDNVPLTLSVAASMSTSRSLITSEILPDGSHIGITLEEENNALYDGISYSNTRFTAERLSDRQIWNSSEPVMLSASKASLYAYFPYSEEVDDISSIPVKATSDIQTDYMYSEPVRGLNNHNPDATILMKHALAAIRLSISRGTYTGKGEITSVTVSGEAMAGGGILNARTGEITDLEEIGAAISLSPEMPALADDKCDLDIITIPSGRKAGLCIEIVMDEETFKVTADEVELEPGMLSIFEIKANNATVDITPLRVKAWDFNKESETSIGKKWNITLTGNTEGLTFSDSVEDDGSITITAVPPHSDAEVNPVTIEGTADVSESIDEDTGARIINLSDIGSDVIINFSSYCLWITAVYDITSIEQPTRLLDYDYYPNRIQCKRMKVDGNEVITSNSYLFDSIGEHTLKFTFSDREVIPSYAFIDNPNLKQLIIPEGVKKVCTYSIHRCSKLENISLPQTLIYSEYDAMSYNTSLKSIRLPDNLVMASMLLRGCRNLEEVTLPANLKAIPSSCFSTCINLKEITIPDSVTSIAYGAFESTGLTSLSIPESITSIPDKMCYSCSDLVSIELPSGIASIGNESFRFCFSLKEISYRGIEARSNIIFFPEGFKSIGNLSFNHCDLMTGADIPASLTSIGMGSFSSSYLNSVSVDEGNPDYETIPGFKGIIEKSANRLIQGTTEATVIPESVTEIGDYAYCNIALPSVDIHSGVTYIGNYAFETTKTLKCIISRSPVPPATGTSNVFTGPFFGGVLKVPQGSIEAYTATWMKNSVDFLGFPTYRWSITELKEGE